MNHMLPSFRTWITSAIVVACVVALPAVVAHLRLPVSVEACAQEQEAQRAADVMLDISPEPREEQGASPDTTVLPSSFHASPTRVRPSSAPAPALTSQPPVSVILANHSDEPPNVQTEASTQQAAPAEVPLLLETELPDREAELFEALRDEGLVLQREDGVIPAYAADIPPDLIDQWLARGLAKLVVVAQHSQDAANGIYVFDGQAVGAPGRCRVVAVTSELTGFSPRYISLSRSQGQRLIARVPASNAGTMRLTPGILIRADLDAVVLAVQERAARALAISLDQIGVTYGRFMVVNGLPFSYEIDRVQTVYGHIRKVPSSAAPRH